AYPRDLRFFSAGHNAAITGARHPVASRQEVQSMQPNRQPLDDFIHHPALSHLAPGASIPSIVEDAVQRRRRADCELSGGADDEGDSSAAGPEWRTVGQRLAGLRATLTLPLPRINIRRAYRALIRRTVTLVTFGWRGPTRRVRLDPALGTLRNSG